MSESEYYTILPFELTYNGHDADDYGGWLATVPKLTHSTVNRDRFAVPARDGELLGVDTQRSNAHVTATFHAKDSSNFAYLPLSKMRRWLTGTGLLNIVDMVTVDHEVMCYEVLDVNVTDETKVDSIYGRLSVDFEIYPYEFEVAGYSTPITTFPITNNYDESMPIYKITSSSNATGTLTVNSKNMSYTIQADKPLFIDTRRMIAYDSTGANRSRYVDGDYEDLHLKHGSNTINCTHTLQVTPRWGYFI